MIDKCLLQRMQRSGLVQIFDGTNLGVAYLNRQRMAGENGAVINQHRTRAASGLVARNLGTRQAEAAAKNFGQGLGGQNAGLYRLTVDLECQGALKYG